MGEDDLRRQWRYGVSETPGYQPQFEQLFEEVYDLPDCRLEHYFDEIQLQHATRYAYGERIAVRDEDGDRLSLSRSYERFARALHESRGPWTFEKEPGSNDEIERGRKRILARIERGISHHSRQAGLARFRDLTSEILPILAFGLVSIASVEYSGANSPFANATSSTRAQRVPWNASSPRSKAALFRTGERTETRSLC